MAVDPDKVVQLGNARNGNIVPANYGGDDIIEKAGLENNVWATRMDAVLGWARKFSLFQYPFVTACCGMEFMAVSGSHYDTDRFGAALPRFLLSGLGRWQIAGLLLAGAAVHLGVDVMQEHLRPSYRYLFPVSMRPCELGWFGAEASLTWWPWLIPATVASLAVSRWRWRQNDARPGGEAEAGA